MTRIVALFFIAVFLLSAFPAMADITQKYSLNYMRPYNSDAAKVSKGNFGASWEMEFHLEGVPDIISWGAGLDFVDMLGERSTYRDSYGDPYIHELDQNYFHLWFGPRLRSHNKAPVRPYMGTQLSLILYEYSSSLYIPGLDPTYIDRDFEFALGYGIHGGVEFRFSPAWSLDLGVKYLKTFGEPRQLSFDSVTVYPSYLLYQIGVRFVTVE
jgi:opacity protein-like surface antigen